MSSARNVPYEMMGLSAGTTFASHTMPDFATPLIVGYVSTSALLMLVVSAFGVRLFVRPFAGRQLTGMLTSVLTGTALSVAGAVIAIVFGVQAGAAGFLLSGGVALCMCAYVSYRVARFYAPPRPAPVAGALSAAGGTPPADGHRDNPYAPPRAVAAASATPRKSRSLTEILHPPVEPTRIHRLLRRSPGELPRWVCHTSVGGVSLLSVAPVLTVALGMGLATLSLFWIGPAAWGVVAITIWAALKTATEGGLTVRLERRCRARLRRAECLQCGERLGHEAPGRICLACHERNPVSAA